MLPKFTLAIQKHNRLTAGRCLGHNGRMHATASQLPQHAWLTSKGHHPGMEWQQKRLESAKALAKRKDAVIAIEFIIQVGDQTCWRETPTKENPYGRPRSSIGKDLKSLLTASREAAVQEFGQDNLVGVDLHTDESSPHVHVVVTPVKAGRLQAKAWLNGARMCAKLRARMFSVVNRHLPCEYTPGARGGAPHDPRQAAGGPSAPQAASGIMGAVRETLGLDVAAQIKTLKSDNERLGQEKQMLFSKVKRIELRLQEEEEQHSSTRQSAQAEQRRTSGERGRLIAGHESEKAGLLARIERLMAEISELHDQLAQTRKRKLKEVSRRLGF